MVQTCIVHLMRNSLNFASWKDNKELAANLKLIYGALDEKAVETALIAFETAPGAGKYPTIGQIWRRAWQEVIPFFAFPKDVLRIIYKTNAVDWLNFKLWLAIRVRGNFPNDDAALKLLLLVLNRTEKEWKMPPGE